MACIERTPRCGESDVIQEPTGSIFGLITTIAAIVGVVITLLKYKKAAAAVAKVVAWLGGAFFGGAAAGFLAAAATLGVIGYYLVDRCNERDGSRHCLAGVVVKVVQDFNGTLEEIFPFTAMHDRVDVLVKSRYWDIVENNAAKVFCTDEDPATLRQSEIIRCYYYTERVCDAARGAFIGGTVGAIGGIVAGAFIAAAIGCATIIFCLLAILVAAIVAAAAVLVGAVVGGQIGKGASDNTSPSDNTGNTISTGDFLTVFGNVFAKDYDDGANVVWWVDSSVLAGRASDAIPNDPYSYCDINDEFVMDACPVVID